MSHPPAGQNPGDGYHAPQYQPHPGQQPGYGAPQGQYYPNQQPPKKKGGCFKIGCLGLIGLVVLIGIIAAVAGAIGGGDGGDNAAPESNDAPASAEQSDGAAAQDVADEPAAEGDALTLEGTATGSASSNYGPAGTSSTADFAGSWSEEVSDAESSDMYGVTIQDMSGADDAEVGCRILKDGEVVAEEKATGAYSIVTCTQPLF